jgi:recombination protein RecT
MDTVTHPPVSAEGVRPHKRLHPWREPVRPRPAATILLLREGVDGFEVLMTRRSATASFAPGAYVFPGGALDSSDASEHAQHVSVARPSQSLEQRAFSVASIREAFEELGVLLAYRADGSMADGSDVARLDRAQDANFLKQMEDHGYRLAVDQVWWLCHWITDRDLPKRFDARFFVARMPAGQVPVADEGEQFEPVWITPKRALERHAAGEFTMIFPTIRTLRRLAGHGGIDSVIDSCRTEKPLFVSSPRGGMVRGEVERFSEEEMEFGELELVAPDGQLVHDLGWQHERAVPLLKHVLRLTAPNPGMMTGPGTNTYIVGEPGGYAVIDPGPDDDVHVDRIAAIVGKDLRYILCTHAHPDHSPGAARLKQLTGAPILGRPWGPRTRDYGAQEGDPQREHTDPAFVPDRTLEDGERIVLPAVTLTAIHTPGHASNHLCFLAEEDGLLFSGDHINNGSTVVISPPDGNMQQYLDALERLQSMALTFILPAHGHAIGFAHTAISRLIAHRLGREAKVLRAVRHHDGATLQTLVRSVYDDVRPALHPVASRSLLAHLQRLEANGEVVRSGDEWRAKG